MYQRYSGALTRYARTLAGDGWLAQDAVQECFLRYLASRQVGLEIDNPRAWLAAVLRNYLLDARKRVAAVENADLAAAAVVSDPAQDPFWSVQGQELERELERLLSPRERECLRLRLRGMRQREIASALGLKSGTVGVLLSRASRKVQQAVES
ncbi:MAG: sigma-70 family RNA polymerase sigma factor [Bryobacteraceae bacterium]|nr:sigma-70 family RNA polymerase sigma factor [Bryobacteraceae bacterium]